MNMTKRLLALLTALALCLSLAACSSNVATSEEPTVSDDVTVSDDLGDADESPAPTEDIDVDLSQDLLAFAAGLSQDDVLLTVNGEWCCTGWP
jgi:ABC-type Fe3+-hydroxamate transport system substrate-binding protein